MSLFIPITKIDVAKRLVYGTLSEEIADKTGEILDYESAKPAFSEWSQQFHTASRGKSMGNVRAMHGNVAAGKFTTIDFDDANKRITGVAKIVDEEEWQKVLEGVYTGFSIGGGYARRWRDAENPALMRYTPVLTEVSLVDNPAVPTATFEVIKLDGSIECKKFNNLVKETEIHTDDNPRHSAALLTELAWLTECIKAESEEEKLLPHIIALQHYLAEEAVESEAVAKFLGFSQSIHATITALQKRIDQLEAQPLPAKGMLRVITKSDDRRGFEEEAKATPNITDLMKMALANPVVV